MISLTKLAHAAAGKVLEAGDIAIDLTAGNGHDTLFLARSVSPTGHVYAFDLQASAIQATEELLKKHSLDVHVTLRMESHTDWGKMIPDEPKSRIKVVMMNLGYLPGGDKSLVTCASSTLPAIDIALDSLKLGGLLTVLAYTGHPGGKSEADAVQNKLAKLAPTQFEYHSEPTKPSEDAPVLHLVSKIS